MKNISTPVLLRLSALITATFTLGFLYSNAAYVPKQDEGHRVHGESRMALKDIVGEVQSSNLPSAVDASQGQPNLVKLDEVPVVSMQK